MLFFNIGLELTTSAEFFLSFIVGDSLRGLYGRGEVLHSCVAELFVCLVFLSTSGETLGLFSHLGILSPFGLLSSNILADKPE